ncbi:unnamed protein product [Allacma fusca]|uniref:Peptide-methionine (R)-S-oxide reductase n=1 Tax=Allacma fusca TaxID=39272 RepID=A0A8J2KHF9_9HEXA|nr:unnamed protein product [Allacma fusca]
MSQSEVNYSAKGVCANNQCCGDTTILDKEVLTERKLKLTPMEFRVTQERQTERPFSNKYNKHWDTGIYNCIVCNTELFRSETKFESKSGWPAFSNVVDTARVKLTPDLSHVGANLLLLVAKPDLARTEVSCANCNAHLGHLFKDGPKPTGLRYCINSSSLVFFPSEGDTTGVKPDEETTVERNGVTVEPMRKEPEKPVKEPEPRPVTLAKTSCPAPSVGNSAKICFFQSAAPLRKNGNTSKNLMVNSSSSGSLGNSIQ